MFVSEDPEAKNSPKGWKSRDAQFDLCPVKVRTTAIVNDSQYKQRQLHNTIAAYVFNAKCTETSILFIPFASSTSHIFIVPLAEPAPMVTSEESKLTDSTGLVRPDRLCNVQ